MNMTIATYITFFRIIFVPFIVYAIMQGAWGQVIMLYAAAMITDFLDGFIARKYNQETMFGALLDPLADKLLICASMYGLTFTILTTKILQYAVYFILIKECALVVGAAILFVKYKFFIRPTLFSRIVSVAEMLFVMFMIITLYFGYLCSYQLLILLLGTICIGALMLLLWYSVIIYKHVRKS